MQKGGKLIGIIGPMFSNKTSTMLDMIKRDEIAGKPWRLFKPAVDQRYSKNDVVTHNLRTAEAIVVKDSSGVIANITRRPLLAKETVYFDEMQFFDFGIVGVILGLVRNGINVTYTLLPTTAEGIPFLFSDEKQHVGYLLALNHDKIIHLNAVCTECGADASYTFFKHGRKSSLVLIGKEDTYTAHCHECYWKKVGNMFVHHFDEKVKEKLDHVEQVIGSRF